MVGKFKPKQPKVTKQPQHILIVGNKTYECLPDYANECIDIGRKKKEFDKKISLLAVRKGNITVLQNKDFETKQELFEEVARFGRFGYKCFYTHKI